MNTETDFGLVVPKTYWKVNLPGHFKVIYSAWLPYFKPGELKGVWLIEEATKMLNPVTKRRIPIWKRGKFRLEVLKDHYEDVALHHNSLRGLFLTKETSKTFWYYEFKNLDELRRLPPKGLVTAVPFQAAVMGIDLEERERRPKSLHPLTWDLTLSKEQLNLAIHNINAIKKVLKGPND